MCFGHVQRNPGDGANAGTKGNGRASFMSPEQQQTQLNALTNAVGLTPNQVTQVQAINSHAMSQTLDIRNSGDARQPPHPK